jgi:TolB-like protein/Flp pilus assembly protein TadD
MSTPLRVDCFEVDLAAGRLLKHGIRIHLREQSFRVLELLLAHPGDVVTREDLRRVLWPADVFVDFENNLNAAVARLREALGDSAEQPHFIETLPKRGYRFIAPVIQPAPVPSAAPPKRVRLLVLPFVNASGDPAQEFFSDAMTDDVITELAAMAPGELAVIARTTAMRYKGSHKDVVRIGRDLKADYVVEGGVRRADGRIYVNAQVIRAGDQEHVFAKRYDESAAEVFRLQGRIAREIADSVGTEAGIQVIRDRAIGGHRVTRMPTADATAYNEYVQGLFHLDHMTADSGDHLKAKLHLERALARDPEFALAHEAMAQVYWIVGYTGLMPPKDAFAAGILHAVRALAIDNTRAEVHALIAQYHKQLGYDWPVIERELTRALELDPASPLVRMLYAVGLLMPQGRLGDAIAELDLALERDPLSYQLHYWRTIMLILDRQADRVITQARLLIELEPEAAPGWWLLGVALTRTGRFDEGLDAVRKAVELSGAAAWSTGWLGLVLGLGGRTDEAGAVLQRLETMSRTAYVAPASFAWVYLGLRDLDRAFEWLDRAVDAHDQLMMPIKSYVFFDPIRNDPRFHALLRKMRLEP